MSAFRSVYLRKLSALALLVSGTSFSMGTLGCATHVGDTIDVPNIPVQSAHSQARGKLNVGIAFADINDVRDSVLPQTGENIRFTEPKGNIGREVQRALETTFAERGILSAPSAPTKVWGEVRKWRAKVTTTTTNSIESEAALYLEVLDAAGSRLYSGTYHGSRTSQFPFASAQDIKDSLGTAMAQAITQVLDDEEFLNALLSY